MNEHQKMSTTPTRATVKNIFKNDGLQNGFSENYA